MNVRMNAGYIILSSICFENVEFVMGVNATAPSKFVTWECKNGTDYYWGHYMNDELLAIKDLLERAGRELKFQTRNCASTRKIKLEKEYER